MSYTIWLHYMEEQGMIHPRQLGDYCASTRGNWALLVVLFADSYVKRFASAPDLKRPAGWPCHSVKDQHGNMEQVVVVRDWEAEHLQKHLPESMRDGPLVFYTGSWESISLKWAHKDRENAPRLPPMDDMKLPLRAGETFAQPLENGYPVWYFLTGPISRPGKMKALWRHYNLPYRRRATVKGFKTIQHVCDHYDFETLVKCSAKDKCRKAEGIAYLVKDQLSEDRLRYFHANIFRIIPCRIKFRSLTPYAQAREVDGLTFVSDSVPDVECEICESAKKIEPNTADTKKSIVKASIVLESHAAAIKTRELPPKDRDSHYDWPRVNEIGRRATDNVDQRRKRFHPDYRRRSPLVPGHLQNPSYDDSKDRKKETAEKTEETEMTETNEETEAAEQTEEDETDNSWKDEPLGITTTTTVTESGSSLRDEANSTERIEDVATIPEANIETEMPKKKKEKGATAWWNNSSETATTETVTRTTTEIRIVINTARITVTEIGSSSEGEDIPVEHIQDSATTEEQDVLEEAVSTPVPESDEEGEVEDST